jgi:hypothetical protein
MEGEVITEHRAKLRERKLVLGGSHARIIVSGDEAPQIRLRTGDHSRVRDAKSSTAQAQCPRPIGRNRRRAGNRQRQTAGKLVTFLTGIRRFVNANAILWQKLYARFSEHTFDQGNRVPFSRVATQLNIRDRVSTQTGCLRQVPNRPIERGPSDLVQLPRARKCAHLTCDKVTTTFTTSPNQGGIQ